MNDQPGEPTEEQLREAFEEQLRQVSVEDVILQTVATLVNLAARRLGLIPEEGEDPSAVRDLQQAQLAIEGARALAPLCPDDHQDSIRQALSQLQLAFAGTVHAEGGAPPTSTAGEAAPPGAGEPAGKPAQAPSSPPAADPEEAERAKARSKIWTPPGT
jgi:hypothetical protein